MKLAIIKDERHAFSCVDQTRADALNLLVGRFSLIHDAGLA